MRMAHSVRVNETAMYTAQMRCVAVQMRANEETSRKHMERTSKANGKKIDLTNRLPGLFTMTIQIDYCQAFK